MIGELLNNRYSIQSEVGRGGFGVVYRANDALLEREVAIKVLSPSALGSQGSARLLQEARSAAQLNHPNIVAVYDAGEQGGSPYIVMEYIEGETLNHRRPESLKDVISIARQICAALDHAHAHNIVHRDLKPENVIFEGTSDRVKLMDFGLAHSTASRLTVDGSIAGTVFYLAPELALGQPFDGRSDLYALGVILYELLAGRLPFTADDPLAVISQHLYTPVVPPRAHNESISHWMDALIVRLLSKRPEDRPASAQEVLQTLDALEIVAEEAPPDKLPLLEWIARGRMVGRSAEMSALREHWMYAQQGNAHFVLISGEPGIGKTRLAEELIALARLQGAWVLKGGCYEYEAVVPYLPLAEALREWVDAQSTDGLQARLGATAAELAKLVPEIEARLGSLPPNPPLTPEEERRRLFDQLARFLEGLAEERGLLLVIDDLHWSDRSTLALLYYLLRRLRNERLMLLAAYREIELDRAHPLAEALVEWNRERLTTRLQLNRLSLEDCRALLAGMFGQETISAEFAQAVYRETEGNPYFIEEVIKALVEGGQIYRQAGAWERLEIDELAIPQSIKEAIGRRLNRLSAGSTEIMQLAAVLGKTFEYAELLAAIQPDGSSPGEEGRLLDALDQALEAQLIRSGGGESFAFTHDKIREVLYEELNPVRRRRLHQRLAQSLERLPRTQVQNLAYHYLQGGDLHQGLRYSLLAAGQSQKLFAYDDALRYNQHAFECAEALDIPEQMAEIHRVNGEIYFLQGIHYTAVQNYQRALELEQSPDERAVLKSRIGIAYAQVGDERGLEFLQEAQDELDTASQADDLAYNLAAMGRYQHYYAQHTQAITYFERARALAEPLDQPITLTHIYSYLAGAYQHMLHMDESTAWARRCIAMGERLDYPYAVAVGCEFLAEDHNIMGRWEESLKYAQRDQEIGEKIGSLDRIAWAGFSKAYGLYGRGELSAALHEAQSSMALAEQIGENRLLIWLASTRSQVEADLGALEVARSSAEFALQQADKLDQVMLQCLARYTLGNLLLRQGDWQAALNLHQEGASLYKPTDNLASPLFLDLLAPRALLSAGRLEEAEQATKDYLELARKPPSFYYEGIALRVLSQVHAAQGLPEEARCACDRAVAVLEESQSTLELGRALHQRAILGKENGLSDGARSDLHRAISLFEASGARLDLEDALRFSKEFHGEG